MKTHEIIPRSEAIDRMRDGLPCETFQRAHADWRATCWHDFEYDRSEFRIPPEPRREAREWWIQQNQYHDVCEETGKRTPWQTAFKTAPKVDEISCIHVREVLPDEVIGQDVIERCIWAVLDAGGDNAHYHADAIRRALGLIKEDKS